MIRITRKWEQSGYVEARGSWGVFDAFCQLVQFELGFGGEVISSSSTELSVRVSSMIGESTTSFSGVQDEMTLLYDVATSYTYLRVNSDEERSKALAPRLVEQGLSKPLFLNMLRPHLLGPHPAKMAAMLVCGIEKEEDICAGLTASWEDFFTALEFVWEDKTSGLAGLLSLPHASPSLST